MKTTKLSLFACLSALTFGLVGCNKIDKGDYTNKYRKYPEIHLGKKYYVAPGQTSLYKFFVEAERTYTLTCADGSGVGSIFVYEAETYADASRESKLCSGTISDTFTIQTTKTEYLGIRFEVDTKNDASFGFIIK